MLHRPRREADLVADDFVTVSHPGRYLCLLHPIGVFDGRVREPWGERFHSLPSAVSLEQCVGDVLMWDHVYTVRNVSVTSRL